MPGSIGPEPEWFGLRSPYNSGLVRATISVTWIKICFTIYSNTCKHWLQTTSFSVFIEIFSSLITKHNWRHNRHNHGRRRRKWSPSAPHEALRSMPMLQMNRLKCPDLADVILGGVEGVYGLQSAPLLRRWWITTTLECLRAIHTLNSPQNYIRLLGGLLPIHTSCWRRAQGLMWGTRGAFPPVAVMVGYGCVDRCWPLEANIRSTYCRNSKNCLQKFFNSYVCPIHFWHLTRQLNEEDLYLCTLLFSWFLCPVFYVHALIFWLKCNFGCVLTAHKVLCIGARFS